LDRAQHRRDAPVAIILQRTTVAHAPQTRACSPCRRSCSRTTSCCDRARSGFVSLSVRPTSLAARSLEGTDLDRLGRAVVPDRLGPHHPEQRHLLAAIRCLTICQPTLPGICRSPRDEIARQLRQTHQQLIDEFKAVQATRFPVSLIAPATRRQSAAGGSVGEAEPGILIHQVVADIDRRPGRLAPASATEVGR
jgi:hypothetical protein